MDSKEVVKIFEEIAALLEISGENSFKVRSYANAARKIDRSSESISNLVELILDGKVKGFGEALQNAISEYRDFGSVSYLDELRGQVPKDVQRMLTLQGLGPKKVRSLYLEHGISSLDDLEQRCRDGSLKTMPGFGPKSEESILAKLEKLHATQHKCILVDADHVVDCLNEALTQCPECKQVAVVGEIRRGCETVSTVALVVGAVDRDSVFECFRSLPEVTEVVDVDNVTVAGVYNDEVRCQLSIVDDSRFELARILYTGAPEYSMQMLAQAKNHGVDLQHILQSSEPIDNYLNDEKLLYQHIGLSWTPPELREAGLDEGQKLNVDFDSLVTLCDVKGILHTHTTYSDGRNTLEEMAQAVKDLGFSYLGVSDHSQAAFYASGLKEDDVLRQHEEIDRLNDKLAPFRIFKGIESDILIDGALDYPDRVLESFDFVIASIHSRFKLDRTAMTQRIVRAVENPFTTILGHMTGRLLLSRDGYEIEVDQVLEAAAKNSVAIEINSNCHRLDIDWRLHQKAVSLGIVLPICPDAHSVNGIHDIEYGVRVARKGLLTPKVIPTCWDLEQINNFFQSKRNA